MIKKTISLAVILMAFFSSALHAQDSTTVRDFELWTGISVNKSFLEDKLAFSLSQEFRFDENALHMNNYFTELGGSYEFIKGLELGVGYRFIRNNRNSGYANEQRFITNLSYKHSLDRFKLQYRFRYQRQDELGTSKDEGDYATSKYRFRVKATYNIKNWKLDPYISVEGFYAQETNTYNYIETITETEKVAGLEKLRFTLGTNYKINKLIEVGAFYRIEQELKSYPNFYNTPATYYIGGINFKFNL
jgi:hypothetical protein